MKKCKFYRFCRDNISKKSIAQVSEGYYDIFTDAKENSFIICFDNYEYAHGKKAWRITEKTTGCKIDAGFNSRIKAVKEFEKKYLDKLQETISSAKFGEPKRIINEAYLTHPLTFKE